MADKQEAASSEPAKKDQTKKKAPAAATEDTSGMMQKKESKQKWTVERAMKTARRFDTEDAWRAGAPASYKAASAHGWVAACTRHMTTKMKPMRRSA